MVGDAQIEQTIWGAGAVRSEMRLESKVDRSETRVILSRGQPTRQADDEVQEMYKGRESVEEKRLTWEIELILH